MMNSLSVGHFCRMIENHDGTAMSTRIDGQADENDIKSWAAVIVAAGRGSRFGGALPKQFRDLCGRPILRRAVEAFLPVGKLDRIVVVVDPANQDMAAMALDGLGTEEKSITIVPGRSDRQGSVLAGLEALAALPNPPHGGVLIHDGVRPLVQLSTIEAVIAAIAGGMDGAIAALPVNDTLKGVSSSGAIDRTVDRTGLYRAQTPQGFRFDRILSAHRQAAGRQLTDDAAVAEAAGIQVGVVADRADNVKITVEDDLAMAELFVRHSNNLSPSINRECEHSDRTPARRYGQGFDVHRTCPGQSITLCGITIPAPFSLSGHSDADVALHAITDAVLGAIADGDIGSHFPPTDPRWKGMDSAVFLKHAAGRTNEKGFRLCQIDLTLICERPKIGPHREAFRRRLADLTGADLDRVAVKATTSERLGFTGRGEGIAAMALVVLEGTVTRKERRSR